MEEDPVTAHIHAHDKMHVFFRDRSGQTKTVYTEWPPINFNKCIIRLSKHRTASMFHGDLDYTDAEMNLGEMLHIFLKFFESFFDVSCNYVFLPELEYWVT